MKQKKSEIKAFWNKSNVLINMMDMRHLDNLSVSFVFTVQKYVKYAFWLKLHIKHANVSLTSWKCLNMIYSSKKHYNWGAKIKKPEAANILCAQPFNFLSISFLFIVNSSVIYESFSSFLNEFIDWLWNHKLLSTIVFSVQTFKSNINET